MKSIEKIEILIKPDNDTSSYVEELGRYSNQWGKYAIDRKIRGDQRPGESRYFHPINPPTSDMTPQERREQWIICENAYKKAEGLIKHERYLTTLRARATVIIFTGVVGQFDINFNIWFREKEYDQNGNNITMG